MSPTTEMYALFQRVFDDVNVSLFDGTLPQPLFALDQSPKTFGYFRKARFVNAEGVKADEIAINPRYFASHGFAELVQTIAHEMCHQWQHHYGKPSRNGYHNAEFAEKMEAIGLMPSDTGEPGGKKTGQRVADYLMEGGPLDGVVRNLEGDGVMIAWYDRLTLGVLREQGLLSPETPALACEAEAMSEGVSADPQRKTKVRYAHHCRHGERFLVWGKPDLPLKCGECGGDFLTGEG